MEMTAVKQLEDMGDTTVTLRGRDHTRYIGGRSGVTTSLRVLTTLLDGVGCLPGADSMDVSLISIKVARVLGNRGPSSHDSVSPRGLSRPSPEEDERIRVNSLTQRRVGRWKLVWLLRIHIAGDGRGDLTVAKRLS